MSSEKIAPQRERNTDRSCVRRFADRQALWVSSHKQLYLISILGALTTMMLLTSCMSTKLYSPTTVDYRDEAGGVLLSVNSVGRWEQVGDAMQPKFNLANGDAALSKVLPVTTRLQQQILDAFGFSLGLGLPQSFRESVAARTASENQTSTVAGEQASTGATSSQGYSSTTTETTKPGVAPTAPGGIPAGGEFPSGTAPGSDLGLDPLLQYRAAASLYQAVQLMNREVELAVKRKKYVPYIVRMQFATIPYRRHMPYDIYAQAAFFPASKTLSFSMVDENTQLPYVVPLIVTDNLEQAIKSRSAEVARQLGLAVSLMMEGVGGNVGSNWEKRNRESVLAADVNSLLTVARMNDNSILIRLGAANEATGGNGLVGRTYDIALLLLVPENYFQEKKNGAAIGEGATDDVPWLKGKSPKPLAETPMDDASQSSVTLSVITHSDFRNASSGKILKERRNATLVEQIDSAFERTLKISYPKMFAAWAYKTNDDKLSIAKKLITPIQSSDYKGFYDEAKSIILKPTMIAGGDLDSNDNSDKCNDYRLSCISDGYLRSLWGYLASTTIESSTKSASVELPTLPDIEIPKQTALIRDDGKEKAEIVLGNVSGVKPGGVSAKLVLINADGKSYEFPAETIATNSVTGTLALQFTSPAKWELGKILYDQSKLVVTESQPCTGKGIGVCATVKIANPFNVLHIDQPAAKPKPGFELRASTNEIVVDKGVGTVKLVFDKFKDDSVTLTWNGAEVKSAKDSSGAVVAIEFDKITVKSAIVLNLEIQNAKPDGKVAFKAVGSKNDKSTGETNKEFTVVSSK